MPIVKNVEKLAINRCHMTFLLPFGFEQMKRREIIDSLQSNGYTHFQLEEEDYHEGDIFGYGIKVVGKELEQYFYPYIEHKLFPASDQVKGFHRYTSLVKESHSMQLRGEMHDFFMRSIDIILAPFGIAFLALRVDMDNRSADLSDVLDFMQHFRALDTNLKESEGGKIIVPETDQSFSVHDYIFKRLCPFLKKNLLDEEKLKGYFGSLPYFEDERMFVSSFLITETGASISDEHLFRIGNVNGKTPSGTPFISSTNEEYIRRSLSNSLHDRWAPHLYMISTEHNFSVVSNRPAKELDDELSEHMGTHFYNLLLHYFYKMMLLRLSFEYSEINWKKDDHYVKSLIQLINIFSSSYYFKEISTRTEGKELSEMFRKTFLIDSLFNEVSNTLQELYKSQENSQADRLNLLLFILTIFTVISGIYGMNLVISDWESPSGWKKYSSYTIFEWISLITAVSGIALSSYLIITTLGRRLVRRKSRKKRNILDHY